MTLFESRTYVVPAIVGLLALQAFAGETPAQKSKAAKKAEKKATPAQAALDPSLPNVLIIGDSISLGYTPPLKELLKGKANVLHSPGNSAGTTHGLANIDKWLEPAGGRPWALIHFNFGLHDFKRVKTAGTTENSNDPNDPRQADLANYEANLKKLVEKLKETKAKLIFATTTPFPAGVKPHRDPEDAVRYNEVATKIMAENGITIDDLYAVALPQLDKLQQPVNVHFTAQGSKALAEKVAESISQQLGQ